MSSKSINEKGGININNINLNNSSTITPGEIYFKIVIINL